MTKELMEAILELQKINEKLLQICLSLADQKYESLLKNNSAAKGVSLAVTRFMPQEETRR